MARLSIKAARENERAVEKLIDKLAEGGRNTGATEAALARRLDADPALAHWVAENGHVPGRCASPWEGGA